MAGSQVRTASSIKLSPLAQRLLVADLIVIVGVSLIAVGGYYFVAFVCLILGLAAWEYWRMYQAGGYRPSAPILIGGTLLLVVTRHFWGFETAPLLFCLFALATITTQVLDYRRAAKTAALDFSINLGGLLYVGWLGAYLITLRNLPDGEWWLLLVIPTVGLCDTGAYLIGSTLGRHPFAPEISPNKTWEGYLGGILFGLLGGLGLALLWGLRAPSIHPWQGLLLGLVLGLLSPLGDLGESVLKRGFGVKDTSAILPGHGGVLDRIDSWLWAAPIGYYLIQLLFLIR